MGEEEREVRGWEFGEGREEVDVVAGWGEEFGWSGGEGEDLHRTRNVKIQLGQRNETRS
mgnify:CR=1 FL=1